MKRTMISPAKYWKITEKQIGNVKRAADGQSNALYHKAINL